MSNPAEAKTIPATVTDRIQEALQSAGGIPTPEDRFWALYKIVWLQIEIGDLSGVRSTLLQMSQTVEAMTEVGERPGFYLYVVEQQVKAGEIEGARATIQTAFRAFETISDEEDEFHIDRDAALVDIVECQAGTGDFAQAQETLTRILSPCYRATGLAKIAIALGSAGSLEEALQTLDKAQRITTQEDLDSSRTFAIQSIGTAQVALAQYVAAECTASGLSEDQAKNGILLDIVREHLKQKNRDAARRILSLMSYPLYICFGLRSYAADQTERGEMPIARATLLDMRARSLALKDHWKYSCLTDVVELLVVAGDLEEAQETLKLILTAEMPGADVGGELPQNAEQEDGIAFARAVALAALSDLDAARPALSRLQKEEKREQAMVRIATFQAKRGHVQEAAKIVEKVQDGAKRVDALTALATALLKPQYPPG